MLYFDDLETKVLTQHQYVVCDELIIISGYVGPNPVQRLTELPIRTTVIYGMYGSNSINPTLHETLMNYHEPNQNEILYSNIPVHSKCYLWLNNGEIVYALIGSANFSTSGLTIPFRETLAETTRDTFRDLGNYLNQILENSVPCVTVEVTQPTPRTTPQLITPTAPNNNSCDMVLYNPRTNEVPESSGLNWGNTLRGHTNTGDGYIPIRTTHIRQFPILFPPKQIRATRDEGGRPHRQNDSIELIWDDGTIMDAVLEGSQQINGVAYPKNLCSFPSKNILGVYLRDRLGLPSNAIVTKADLNRYGRDYITLSLLQDGTYSADFSNQ